jgi:exportin-1
MATFLDSLTFEEISKTDVLDVFVPVMLEEMGNDLELFASTPEKIDVENLVLLQNMLGALTDELPYDLVLSIHQLVFSTVLPNLVEDFGDYPSLRQAFYKFLLQEIDSVFPTFLVPFFHRSPEDFRTIVDAILWGIRHIDEQDISHTSLQMLYDLLHSVATSPEVGELFYHYFYLSIIQDVMQILTDRAHKSGFRLQCSLLTHLGRIVIENKIETPLEAADGSSAADSSNLEFIASHLSKLMLEAFGNSLTQSMISDFFSHTVFNRDKLQSSDRFRQSVRDFLIDMCEFRLDEDSKEMWSHEIRQRREEEREFDANMTPGLVNPNSLFAGNEVYDDFNDDDDDL